MGMELGITGPAGSMAECRTDEPIGFHQLASPGTSPDKARLSGELVENSGDRPIVGVGDAGPDMDSIRRPRAGRHPWVPRTSGRNRDAAPRTVGLRGLLPRLTFPPVGSRAPRHPPDLGDRAARTSRRSNGLEPRPGRGSSRRRCWPPCRGSTRPHRRHRACLSTASERPLWWLRIPIHGSMVRIDVTLNVTLPAQRHNFSDVLSAVDRIGSGWNRLIGIRIGEAHRRHPQRHPPRSEAFLKPGGRAERQRWERVITSVELGHALVPSRMPRLHEGVSCSDSDGTKPSCQ